MAPKALRIGEVLPTHPTKVRPANTQAGIHHSLWFWVVSAIFVLSAAGFAGYVKYQEVANNNHLQIGYSLSPVVSDYFSWSHEEPMKTNELPVVGEYYTYRRPVLNYHEMAPLQRITAKLRDLSRFERSATKQCQAVDLVAKIWDTGSDDKWQPISGIAGRVTEMYDSRYHELSRTPEGRLRLWAERHHLPKTYAVADDSNFAAVVEESIVVVYDTGFKPVFRDNLCVNPANGQPISWRNGRLIYTTSRIFHFGVWDPTIKESYRFDSRSELVRGLNKKLRRTNNGFAEIELLAGSLGGKPVTKQIRPRVITRLYVKHDAPAPVEVKVGDRWFSCNLGETRESLKAVRVNSMTFRYAGADHCPTAKINIVELY